VLWNRTLHRGVYSPMRLLPILAIATALCSAAQQSEPPLHVIPVEVYRNALWVRVSVNSSAPLWFMLDSAAGGSVIARPVAERLGLHIVELGQQADATPADTPIRMAASPNIEYDVGGARFTAHGAVLDMAIPDAVWGRRFEGVLGAELFKKYVVELDWEKREMLLHDPKTYEYRGTGKTFPILFARSSPMLPGRIRIGGKTMDANLLIDSAASSSLVLSSPFVEQHGVLAAVMSAGGRLIEGESIGAGGSSPSASTRAEWLELGAYRIPAPLTTLSKAKAGSLAKGGFDGLIGSNVLRRFRVILDFSNKRAILEPNAHLSDTDVSDGTGLRIRTRGDDLRTYYVHAVVPDSPACQAEISAGDVVISINEMPLSKVTMEQVSAQLRGPGDLKLVVERGGRRRELTLVKTPLL
jgi:hypothetical protein